MRVHTDRYRAGCRFSFSENTPPLFIRQTNVIFHLCAIYVLQKLIDFMHAIALHVDYASVSR